MVQCSSHLPVRFDRLGKVVETMGTTIGIEDHLARALGSVFPIAHGSMAIFAVPWGSQSWS